MKFINLETKNTESGLVEAIRREQQESREKFSSLIDLVNSRYEAPGSALADSPEQLRTFKEHNQQVLAEAVSRGLEKGLAKKDLRVLEVSAILHDMSKADQPAGGKAKIPNYILAAHGEMAAAEVDQIMSDHPEILKNILDKEPTETEKEELLATIKTAIRSHMGPHPGFMADILKSVNKALAEMGEAPLEHPYPAKGDAVAETLLAVDMYSLADRQGRQKVLAIRSGVPFFKKQDEDLCAEYKKSGVDLLPAEAALLSGFDGAEQARNMVKDASDQLWIDQAISASKAGDYKYEGQVVTYDQTIRKREDYISAQGERDMADVA